MHRRYDAPMSDSDEKDKHQGARLTRIIALVLAAIRLIVELRK